MNRNEFRQYVSDLARQLRAGEITFWSFLDAVGPPHDPYETGDDDVDELIDLFEHEPMVGGFGGVPPGVHAEHMAEIDRLIVKLATPNKPEAPGPAA